MSNNFCSNCGSPLNPGTKFCGECGARIITENSAAPTPDPAAGSTPAYKYIIPAQYKKGLLSTKACTLIFTDEEVIVALVDNKLMQKHLKDVRDSVKDEKFMKRTAAVMKAGYTFSNRYWELSRNSILGESNDNFVIVCNTVQTARFSKGSTTQYSDSTASTTPPALVFKTTGGKFIFSFNLSVDTKTFIPMLQIVFSGRYKGPKK